MTWAVTEALTYIWVLTTFLILNRFRPAGQPESWRSDRGEHTHTHVMLLKVSDRFIMHVCVCVCVRVRSVGRTERSALQALRMLLFTHKSELMQEFLQHDPQHTGAPTDLNHHFITLTEHHNQQTSTLLSFTSYLSVFKGLTSLRSWAVAMETVLHLSLPWRVLRSQLVSSSNDGMLNYDDWFNQLSIIQPNTKVMQTQVHKQRVRNHIIHTTISNKSKIHGNAELWVSTTAH